MILRTKNVPVATVRCAIYSRKSTSEGLDSDFNTLDAQREACEAYIGGRPSESWTCLDERYDDGGYSGGDMERPALRRLPADIEAGTIDVVVVYKIDRLSRSLIDFAKMMAVFEKHGASCISIKGGAKPVQDKVPRIARLKALAIHFDRLIREGKVKDYAQIARLGGVTRARVTQVMNLLGLSHDLQERLLTRNAVEVSERALRTATRSVVWSRQSVS